MIFLPIRRKITLTSGGAGVDRYDLKPVESYERLLVDNVSFRDTEHGLTTVEVGVKTPEGDCPISLSGALAALAIGQYNSHQIVIVNHDNLYVKFNGGTAGDTLTLVVDGWMEISKGIPE